MVMRGKPSREHTTECSAKHRKIDHTRSQTLINTPNPLNLVFLDHEFPAPVKRIHDRTSLEHREVLYGRVVER